MTYNNTVYYAHRHILSTHMCCAPYTLPFPMCPHGLDNVWALHPCSSLPRLAGTAVLLGVLEIIILSSRWGVYWKINNVQVSRDTKDGSWKRGPNTSDMSTAWQPDTNFSTLEAASMGRSFLSWFFAGTSHGRCLNHRLLPRMRNLYSCTGQWLPKDGPHLPAAPTDSSSAMRDHLGCVCVCVF